MLLFFSSGLKLNFERYEGTCLGAVGKDVGEQNKFLLKKKSLKYPLYPFFMHRKSLQDKWNIKKSKTFFESLKRGENIPLVYVAR